MSGCNETGHYRFSSEVTKELCLKSLEYLGEKSFAKLVKSRIALLQEHMNMCICPIIKRRMERVVCYQYDLLANRAAVYNAAPIISARRKRYGA